MSMETVGGLFLESLGSLNCIRKRLHVGTIRNFIIITMSIWILPFFMQEGLPQAQLNIVSRILFKRMAGISVIMERLTTSNQKEEVTQNNSSR